MSSAEAGCLLATFRCATMCMATARTRAPWPTWKTPRDWRRPPRRICLPREPRWCGRPTVRWSRPGSAWGTTGQTPTSRPWWFRTPPPQRTRPPPWRRWGPLLLHGAVIVFESMVVSDGEGPAPGPQWGPWQACSEGATAGFSWAWLGRARNESSAAVQILRNPFRASAKASNPGAPTSREEL